jgi:diketogulonate reductase-like aldo/keto reductase
LVPGATFALASGEQIPKLGLGTWRVPDADTSRVVRESERGIEDNVTKLLK